MANEYVQLLGTEDVRTAAGMMVNAAEGMKRAADQIDESLSRHQRFLDDWLARYEEAAKGGGDARQ